jgi:hypothetical protein
VLAKLREKLADGPFETTVGLHGVNVMLTKKVTFLEVDEIGALLKLKGAFGGDGGLRLHPWSSIMFIDI